MSQKQPHEPDSAAYPSSAQWAGQAPRGPVWAVAAGFFVMLLAANLATPLYAGFSEELGFKTDTLALVFAVYALVLIPSLLVFGQISDVLGRRRVIAAGLVVAMVALVLFSLADATWWLFAARATQGLAQGMLSGAATAALAELVAPGPARRAALAATLAQCGGSASGALLAGGLAQWLPSPYLTPFLAGIALCLIVLVLLRTVPETAGASGPGRGWRIQRPRVPREILGEFTRVALTAAVIWSVAAGLFLSVIPTYAADVFATDNRALLGLVAAAMLGSSCLAQILARHGLPSGLAAGGGLLLIALGLLGLVLASPLNAPVLLVGGSILAGLGHGLAFLAAQDDLTQIAPPERRASISAAFYVCLYLGVALPVIGIGILATATTLFTAITTFALITGTAAIALAIWHLTHHRTRHPTRAGEPS